MINLGIFVGEKGLWTFFREIYQDLSLHYKTNIFHPKSINLPILSGSINRRIYRISIRSMLKQNDVCFFEWASELLQVATHMPKYGPIITRLHSFELSDWTHKINWDNVDKVIFISDSIRMKFIERYSDQADKTILIHNAVSINKFHSISKRFDFSLGMLCTLNPIKRIYEIILTVKELRDIGYDATLHIAGNPINDNLYDRYHVSLKRLVQKLKLEQAIIFYGHVDKTNSWLQKIDVFISNSYWEGLQTALLEAMATGCFCLAHFWDGAEEVLPPENIYTTNTELKDKLIEYSKLSNAAQLTRKMALREIVRDKFNLDDKKADIKNVINSFI